MKEHILLTGGSGFIGRNLLNELIDSKYKVTSISRTKIDYKYSYCIDLSNYNQLSKFINNLKKVDKVIHCAAIAHGQNPPKGFSTSEINSLILSNLLRALQKHEPHWVFLSSVAVYGNISDKEVPITLSPNPIDDYGFGKLNDENLLISKSKNLDILRLMPVYCEHNLKDIKKRVYIPKTNLKLMILPPPSYSFCHISNISSSILNCFKYSEGIRLHHIGDTEPVSQTKLINQFSGFSIIVPQIFFKIMLFLISKKLDIFINTHLMLRKVGLNNIYKIGSLKIK